MRIPDAGAPALSILTSQESIRESHSECSTSIALLAAAL